MGAEGHQNALIRISVVVPVYGDLGDSLILLCEQVLDVLSEQLLEVLLVDDGSSNNNWEKILIASDTFKKVKGLRLRKNFTQHNATWAGICEAEGDLVVTMDADLQHDPKDIPRLLDEMKINNRDIVYGNFSQRSDGKYRAFVSLIYRKLIKLSYGSRNYISSSPFRVFRRDLLTSYPVNIGPSVSIDALVSWTTSCVGNVYLSQNQRHYGKSSFSTFSLMRHAVNSLVAFSTMPIRFVAFSGIVISLGSFLIGIYLIAIYLLGRIDVAGFTFVAVALVFFGGIQLFAIGTIGEYVGRIHSKTLLKPTFSIAEKTPS
jgi:glycosyltransferase involved in cell wall biosynthesis